MSTGLYRKAIEHWGPEAQIKIATEECAELIKVLMKYGRKVNGASIEEIQGEVVDVEIMMGQLKEMFPTNYESLKKIKLQRLAERLEWEVT